MQSDVLSAAASCATVASAKIKDAAARRTG
jgi:hypothetical protein